MPKGWCPLYFYENPYLENEKSLEEIYDEIQYYSGEFFPDDDIFYKYQTDFIIPLPPLFYENHFVKGMFMSEGVDYIHSIFPRINELFFSMAYTMWSSIPYSDKAEIYLTCYDNPHRENWFKTKYPDRQNKIFIPLQDADFTNEYFIAPSFATKRDIDVLCISRFNPVKNLPMLLRALMHYHQKYGVKLKTVLISGLREPKYSKNELAVIKELSDIAGGKRNLNKYIKIVDFVGYGAPLSEYYSRAKVFALTSIYEGKNRAINEANCCNTPVVVFKHLSKYTRGNDKAFHDGCGLYVPEFTHESFADTLHEAITNQEQFTPRLSYLKYSGRKNFLNKCIDSIPYYRENIPGYEPGRAMDNLWLDLAMQANYQLSLNDFLYGKNPAIHHTKLHEKSTEIMDFFNARFNIIGGEKVLPENKNA